VEKAVKMAELMNVPVLGIVENMAYFECDGCGKRHYIYGNGGVKKTAEEHGIENVAQIPINPEIASLCDKGLIELFEGDYLDNLSDAIE